MLMIRLQRVGRKNIPTFRVVLTDSKNSTKSGKYIEILGSYDPIKKTKDIDGERIKTLISQGAQLSETMHNLLINQKVISGKKINVLPLKKKTVSRKDAKAQANEKKTAPTPQPAAAPAASAPTPESAPTEAPKA